jgi:hypothetical protein
MTEPQTPHRARRRRRPSQGEAPQLGHVTIGIDDLYRVLVEVRDLTRDLARDQDSQAKQLKDLRDEQSKQGERISRVERWHWKAAGAGTTGGVLVLLAARLFGIDLGGA